MEVTHEVAKTEAKMVDKNEVKHGIFQVARHSNLNPCLLRGLDQ